MRKLLLLFTAFALLPLTSVLSQTMMDYVLEQKGDTLVVKDDYDYGAPDVLTQLMTADSSAPAGRVYELHNGGTYSLVTVPTSSETQKTIIMGENQELLKTSKVVASPPAVSGAVYQGGTSTGGMNSGNDLLVKNIDIAIGNSAGGLGWAWFGFSGTGKRLEVNNCIIEHTLWAVVGGPPADETIFFKNDYFVNLDGHTCRRNGGVVDFNGGTTEDTLLVENCTHVNTQGSLYKWRTGYTVARSIFNHNDFVDCAGYVFMNTGDHSNISITNNVFVNANVQPFSPVLQTQDNGELDLDLLPMGLVNVKDDSAFAANGARFYVDKNLVYWDPTLSDVVSTVNGNSVNNVTNWESQMITMNTRSQTMFDDGTKYPYLTEGTWIKNTLPNFKKTDVLFSTQLGIIKNYAISAVDTTYTAPLPSWRQASNDEATYFIYADWPIPIDLSYDNSDLMTAGLNSFPVGDLNWFPTQYSAWKAQEGTELAQISNTLITAIAKTSELPQKFELKQNYPNPFNPTTAIEFTLPRSGNVTLAIYNALGQKVATLLNGFKAAQTYHVNFDASHLASGVYIYQIRFGNQAISKKMVLMK